VAPLLVVENLKTHFFTSAGVVKAVDDISYDVNEGETLAIVGESGCGKSIGALSLMRLVPSPPGQIVGGRILFDGEELLAMSEAEMRDIRGNRIAMIFQEPMTSLNPVLTIGRQVTESLELHLKLNKTEAHDRAVELLDMVGIPDPETRLKQYPHQFSGGMRQRVMIAIAMSCNPRLLLADEPTTALDVTIQAQILELIKELSNKLGTAVIIITHNLGVVARYADRVNVMYAGKLIERGTALDIYENPHHPYTRGLLGSVPRLDEDKKQRLESIDGMPPDLMDLPPGCAFQPRCKLAVPRCLEEIPPLISVSDGHTAACWVTTGPEKAG
jgi:oligopeptide transport system ATP-binding protein